jgi:enoyl-CoA hydratase
MSTVLVSQVGRVGVITLNRPEALNALSPTLLDDVLAAARAFDADDGVGCIVLTGSDRAFAAGADIKMMIGRTAKQNNDENLMSGWDDFAALSIPIIAAVRGVALGGGCELAMMCDTIFAADDATFGQPEAKLGLIPGLGATQRLTRAIGKARAMDLILTGRTFTAAEASQWGLVSRIVPADRVLDEALEAATVISSYSAPTIRSAKRLIGQAFETTLAEGVAAERSEFFATFDLEDAQEGMAAFVEKRPPEFRNR